MSGLTWGKPNNTSHTGIVIFEFTKLLFVTGINADTWGRQQIAAQTQIHQCMICSSSSSLESGTYPWQWVQPMEWFCHSKWVYTRVYIYIYIQYLYIYIHTLILSLSLYIYIHVVRRAILTHTCTHFGCWGPPDAALHGGDQNQWAFWWTRQLLNLRPSNKANSLKYVYIYIHSIYVYIWLVVDLPLWKIWKSDGMILPNIWENKKCSKPPTSIYIYIYTYGLVYIYGSQIFHNWLIWSQSQSPFMDKVI